MALANMTTPFATPGAPPPGTFDPTKIAQQMQTDPNVRTMFAQFFGDPASRQFVQDSGNVTTALARPDNPWTPGAPVVAASPGPSAESAPTPGASLASREPASPDVPTSGVSASPAGPSFAPNSFSSQGAEVPGRPVGPMDNVHGARKALMLAFLGLNKFGAGLDHQQNSYADEFLGNQMHTEQQQREYDANQPLLRQQAANALYAQNLGFKEKEAAIAHTTQETENLKQNVPALTRQQALIDKVRTLKESGKYASDQDLLNAVMSEAKTVPGMTTQMLNDAIASSKTLGSKYTLTRDPQTEQPIELTDRQGNKYSASNLPNDKEAKQMWDDATTAASSKLQTEEGKEKRVAGYAADRQASAFQHADVEKGRAEATKHLQDIRDASRQQELIQNLLGGKFNPASQTAAVFKMVGLEQPAGSHRVLPAEIDGLKRMGGLSDRASQWFANAKEGDQFPPDLLPDVISTAKQLTDTKIKTANDNLEDVHRVYGYHVNGADPATGRLDGGKSVYGGDVQTPAAAAQGGGKGALSLDEAKQYLQKAGGDKDKARALAKADGRSF